MSNTKSITITPILEMLEKGKAFSITAFLKTCQPAGPTPETQGYAVLRTDDDDLQFVEKLTSDVLEAVTIAKSQARVCRAPFHRPEWLKKLLPEVVGIQVMPYVDIRLVGEPDQVLVQVNGPNAETSGWAVYLRHETGEAAWVADVGNQKDAEFIGNGYAKHLGVEIEPYPWLATKE